MGDYLGNVAGAGIGLLLSDYNDARQIRQQQALMEQQKIANKEMMDYGMGLQYKMWEQTGIKGQIKQLKEAGMNPQILAKGVGAGGSTGNAGTGGIQGGMAPAGGGEAIAGLGMGLQMELLKAQKENIQADTKLKETDAAKKAGVDTENVAAGTENLQANTAAAKVKMELDKIDLKINDWTWIDQVNEITSRAIEQQEKGLMAGMDREVKERTIEENVLKVQNEVAIQGVQKKAIEAGIKLTEEQTAKIAKELALKARELSIGEGHLGISKAQQEFENNWGTILGKEAANAVGGLIKILPFAKAFRGNRPPEVKGFGGGRKAY